MAGAKTKKTTEKTTPKKVDTYLLITPMFKGLFKEIRALGAKRPDAALNKFKVDKINAVLTPALEVLADEPTIQFLQVLSDEALPTYSDALIVMTEFSIALDKFHSRYYEAAVDPLEHLGITGSSGGWRYE